MASDRTQGGRSAEVTETLVSVPFDGGSDGLQRMRPMHGRTSGPTRRSTKGQWTPEEDDLLHKAVQRFKGRNWKRIAECFKDRTDVQCLHRWQKVLNPELVKGPWSKEEDDIIIELVNKYGAKKWSTIAQALPGRIGKQCRERWHNHLNPSINKDAWTQEEELVLIQAHQIYGNKWAELTKFLPGRTDNSIKNHWNSSVKKKLDSYLASGLLTKFQGLPHLSNPNQCMPSSSLRTQQSSGENSVLKDVAETEEISECSQVSTAAGCSQSDHDMAHAVSVQTQEFKLSAEEASQRMGQNSCMLSCSQQYYPLEEVPELSHELESSVDLSEQNIFSEFGVSESNNDHFSSHELPRMSSPEVAQEPPAFFETSAPCMEHVDENHKTEPVLLQESMDFTAATSMGSMILGSDGQDHASKSEGDRCGVMFPESRTDGCFSMENQIDCSNINLDGCVNSFICQSDIQGSEADRSLTSQSYYSLQSSDMMGASTSQPLSSVPSLVCTGESELIRGSECNEPKDGSTGNQELGFLTSSRDNFIHLNVSTCSSDGEMDKFCLGMEGDQSRDDSKSVPVDIFSSLTSELTEMLPCMDESTTVHTENPDTGALYYEHPRFPSLEIPFVSCDLISSSDLQQAYSPLGIRQLTMSSMNCSSPYSLWDSPARDCSPDLVLKNAAKSFICTPSILKKRSRDLLSPLQEKKSDKRLVRDTNQGMFCTSELARDFSFLDVVFDDKVDRRRASLCSIEEAFLSPSDAQQKNLGPFIHDKENSDHASKAQTGVSDPPEKVSEKGFDDTNPPEKTRQGCGDRCKVQQPSGVLIEQNVNNMMLFSPDRDRCHTNKTLSVGTKTPRNEKLQSGRSESLLGKPCLSVIVSPTFRGKRHGKNVVPLTQCATSSGPLEVASENGGDSVDIESLSMFGDTPNFKRSIESPSAWKSPWFMNSFLPGPRVDTDITIEDIGYFMSPGERSYDAFGLMKQFSEHTAAVVAEAEEILASDNPVIPSKERCSTDWNSAQNCNHISDEELPCGVLSEQRVLDFSGCATPEKQIEIGRSVGTIYGAGFSSSPSSYLIKGCR